MAGSEPAVLDPPEASPPAVVPGFAAEVCAYFEYVAIALLVKQSAWEQVCVMRACMPAAVVCGCCRVGCMVKGCTLRGAC